MEKAREKIIGFLKGERVWIAGIFVIGLIMRIVYMQENRTNPQYISETSFLAPPPSWFDPVALWHSPVFPYLARGIFNIFVRSHFMLKISFFVIGSMNLILIYVLTKKIFNVAVARIASFIALIYVPFIFYEGDLFEPPFAILFGVILFLMVLNALEKPSRRRWFVCGIFWALSMLIRHHFLLFGFVAIAYLAIGFFKNKSNKVILVYIVCMLAGFAITIAPMTLRNIIVGKDFVLTGYVEGVSLWHGNNPDFEKLRDRASGFGWEEILRKPFKELKLSRPIRPSDVSRYFFNETVKFVTGHPIEWLKLMGRKTVYFFSGYESMGDSDIYSYMKYSPLLRMFVGTGMILYPFGIICPLAIVGTALSMRNNRRTALLALMIISSSFLSILLPVQSRYRTAAAPFFIIAAAYLLWWWYKNAMNKDKRKIVSISAASFMALLLLCNIYHPEMSVVNKARIFDKNGEGYIIMKNLPQAIKEFQKALAVYPDNPSPMLHLKLVNCYMKQNDPGKAAIEYEKVLGLDPNNTRANIELGRIFENRNEPEKAIVMYKKALALPLSPDYQMSTHFSLGAVYKKKMFYNDAVTEFQFVTSHEGNPKYNDIIKRAYLNLAEIYEIAGKRDDAISMYEQSLRLDPGDSLAKSKIAAMREDKEPEPFEVLSPVEVPKSAIPPAGYPKAQQNDPGKAAIEYEKVLGLDPNNTRANIELGRIFENRNEPEKAIVMYKKALALPLSPDYQMSTHFALGAVYKKKMFYNDAVTEFQFVTSHEGLPQYNDIVKRAYLNLAEIYEIAGKRDDAISMYEQSLRLDPGDSLAKSKIAGLCASKSKNPSDR